MSDLLSFFGSNQAEKVFSNTQSLFLHSQKHAQVMPFIQEYKILDNKGSSPTSFNTTYSFEIYDNGDMVGDCYLKLVVPAVTVNGSVNPRFMDYGGLYTISAINYYHGGVQVNTITPDEILIFHLRKKSLQQIIAFQNLVGGNLSTSTRITNAAAAQTFYIPILPWWARSSEPDHFLPVRYISGKNVTRIDVVFNPYTYFLQSDSGSPTVTITTLQMLTSYFHLSSPQQLAVQKLCNIGYEIKMVDTSQKVTTQPLLLGSSSYTVKIDNFRSPISEIYFVIRNTSDVSTNYGNNVANFQDISGFYIQASGTDIIKQNVIDENVNLHIINAKKYLGYDGNKIFGFTWSWNPVDEANYFGALDFQNFTNPTLTVTFTTALTVNCQLDVYSIIDNFMYMSNNIVKKMFN